MHPILFEIGPVTIYSYGLMLGAAFLCAVYLLGKEASRKGLDPERIVNFGLCLIFAGVIGSHISHLILYDPHSLWRNPLSILKLWQGGLTIYGALITGIFVGIIFARRSKISFWMLADTVSPSIILAQAVGRIGCFLNGCCFGKETSLPWAVTFTDKNCAAPLNIPLHPVQLYSSIANFLVFIVIWKLRKRCRGEGSLFLLYLALYSGARFITEFYRQGFTIMGLPLAQIVGLATIIACAGIHIFKTSAH